MLAAANRNPHCHFGPTCGQPTTKGLSLGWPDWKHVHLSSLSVFVSSGSVTKHHTRSGLSQNKFNVSHFWGPKHPHQIHGANIKV